MSNGIEEFKEQYPSLDSYWRSIILFGRNVASYKFALAKSLLDIVATGKTIVSLEELAVPYSSYLCQHVAEMPRQATSQSSQFLDACKKYNEGQLTHENLIDITVAKGFNNVIDAFHIVNHSAVPIEFYKKDYEKWNKNIILTDQVFRLIELPFSENFNAETESRWKLVETAWKLRVSRNLLHVRYDDSEQILFIDENSKRKNVTSAKNALNGYQKGKCFYCFDNITVVEGTGSSCDVDHFFPHTAQPFFPDVNLDGIWNLVLACPRCNRGQAGKFALVPAIKYLQRLHKRNEFLICSHHPLKETIIRQTGNIEKERREFLLTVDQRAVNILINRWSTEQIAPATF